MKEVRYGRIARLGVCEDRFHSQLDIINLVGGHTILRDRYGSEVYIPTKDFKQIEDVFNALDRDPFEILLEEK